MAKFVTFAMLALLAGTVSAGPVTVIPEPEALPLLGLGLAAALIARRSLKNR